MSSPDMSVVVGFRDWGAKSLRRSVNSLQAASGDLDVEIIISDYGSSDPAVSRNIAELTGARWVSTPRASVWSRSGALNAGFAIARGSLLVSTDADMLFAPHALEAIHRETVASSPCASFLQCRDLPESFPQELFDDLASLQWDDLAGRSQLRPRWGMGGMMAIDRQGFTSLHGFDERLHTYGREDMDFALRARRAGHRTIWVQDEAALMYHMWHPESYQIAQRSDSGRRAVARNRQIVDTDGTTARNVTSIRRPLVDGAPLLSLIVLGGDPHQDPIGTIATCLAQSVHDLEVIVCTGSEPVPESLHELDERIRTVPSRDSDGTTDLAAAISVSRGTYIAVIGSGDLLPLDRSEVLLSAIVEGSVGAQGLMATSDGGEFFFIGTPRATDATLLCRRDVAIAALSAHSTHPHPSLSLSELLAKCGFRVETTEKPVVLRASEGIEFHGPVHSEPAASSTDLAALLPAGQLGGTGRDIHFVATGEGIHHPLPAAGPGAFLEITRGDEIVYASAVAVDASYEELARLASSGMPISLVPSGTVARSVPSWPVALLPFARRPGSKGYIAVRARQDDGAANDGQGFLVRTQNALWDIEAVEKEHSSGPPPEHAWMIVGATAEEVWR